ncbi:ABC transporter substrate-binding protein [Methylobacterium durans]|uniref:ABC transporter substrate-binding protein n=1 Tax=Methylobacterium durans TaxID=2202825 RepID=UPI002AFDD79E|nr:ABC transporter substrate-binding protein [Methylobacterium durans]MEA1834951.1 ABC transporter substrate-binding protein [Methylobacterium durans]
MRAFLGLWFLIVALGATVPALAEGRIRIAAQYGIAFLPLYVVQDQQLIEKHARSQGVDISVDWVKVGGGSAANDALLSGSVDVTSGGIGPALTIWDRTRGSLDVKAVAALGCQPLLLVTNNPQVRSIKDLTPGDKIALPAVGISVHARTLQIAAEQAFGPGKHEALDALTISLPHPDAATALLSGSKQITAHFSNAPFSYRELRDPNIRTILSSYDVLGGPATGSLIYTTSKFRADNPKTYRAFVAAVAEATTWIRNNKAAAAETYIRIEQSKLSQEEVQAVIGDKDFEFTTTPRQTFKYAEFMARIRAIRRKPDTWRDYFFDDFYDQSGS